MLQNIGKIPKHKAMIEKARSLMIFLYSHHRKLALMRTPMGEISWNLVLQDLLQFFSLGCLVDKKFILTVMLSSKVWKKRAWSNIAKGKAAQLHKWVTVVPWVAKSQLCGWTGLEKPAQLSLPCPIPTLYCYTFPTTKAEDWCFIENKSRFGNVGQWYTSCI